MDIAGIVNRFATGKYTVTRPGAGSFDHGLRVPGSSTSFDIYASVQPLSGNDLQRLPEGRRDIETRKVYTVTQLQTGGEGAASMADRVVIDGATFEVQTVETWHAPQSTGTGYMAIVQAVAT